MHYLMRDGMSEDGLGCAGRRRMGLAVSKAVGNAVVRNAVKRRFRALARQYEASLPQWCDVVMRAKPSAATASFRALELQVSELFQAVSDKRNRLDFHTAGGDQIGRIGQVATADMVFAYRSHKREQS